MGLDVSLTVRDFHANLTKLMQLCCEGTETLDHVTLMFAPL